MRRLTPPERITAYGYVVGGLFSMALAFNTHLYRPEGRPVVFVCGLVLVALGLAVFVRRRETPTQTLVQSVTTIGVVVACGTVVTSPVMATATAAALGMLTLGIAARCARWQTYVVMVSASVAGVGVVARMGVDAWVLFGVGGVVVGLCTVPALMTLHYRRQLESMLERVKVLATTDPLTGLTNRRGMDDLVPLLVSHTSRGGRSLAVLMVDIDHFKQFNDSYGHLRGDEALRAVAGVVRSTVRQTDIVARFGGEEFCVVASFDRVEDLEALAERIRKNVEADAVGNVTVSIGGYLCRVTVDADAVSLVWSMVALADERLYAAKEAGRNTTRLQMLQP